MVHGNAYTVHCWNFVIETSRAYVTVHVAADLAKMEWRAD